MNRKTIRLDEDTMQKLEYIDKKYNLLKSNHNAVIVEAIQRMYFAEKEKDKRK